MVLSNQTAGLFAGVARRYKTAAATTTIHQTEYEVKLRSTLNEVAAIRDGTRHIVFSEQGPLSREELDLLKLPVPSSEIDTFLPANLQDLEVFEHLHASPRRARTSFPTRGNYKLGSGRDDPFG